MNICEREGCDHEGRSYQRCGRVVQSPAVGFNTGSGATVPQPEPPTTLCPDHAMKAFGWAVTS